jgi:hypothetical protein
VAGWWFSLGMLVSSTNKTDCCNPNPLINSAFKGGKILENQIRNHFRKKFLGKNWFYMKYTCMAKYFSLERLLTRECNMSVGVG